MNQKHHNTRTTTTGETAITAAGWTTYGRPTPPGKPEFREPTDTTSMYHDRPAQRDNLDSGTIIITEEDLRKTGR